MTALRRRPPAPAAPAAAGGTPAAARGRRLPAPDVLALLALLVLAGWQLWPAAGPGRLPQNLDLMLQYVPNAAYLRGSLLEGRLPLWNPFLGAGMPFAADPGAGAWYLPNWLPLLLLPLDAAVRVILWTHLAWGAAGTYLFLRRVLGVSPAAAWIGAAAFALTTWLPGLAGMAVVLSAVAWLPWLLLLGDLALRRGGPWTVALALAGALQAVAGWPAGAYLSWLTLAALLLLRPARTWPRAALRLAGAGGLAALLAGVLLLPAAEFIGQTSYAETRSVEQVAADGYLTLLSWLRPAGGAGALESSQLYLGMTPFLLALAALVAVRRRAVLVLGAVALLGLVLAERHPRPALLRRLPLPAGVPHRLPAGPAGDRGRDRARGPGRPGGAARRRRALALAGRRRRDRARRGGRPGRPVAVLALRGVRQLPAPADQRWSLRRWTLSDPRAGGPLRRLRPARAGRAGRGRALAGPRHHRAAARADRGRPGPGPVAGPAGGVRSGGVVRPGVRGRGAGGAGAGDAAGRPAVARAGAHAGGLSAQHRSRAPAAESLPAHAGARRPGLQPAAAAPRGGLLRRDQRRTAGRPLAAARRRALAPGRRPGRAAHPDRSGAGRAGRSG